MFDDLNPALGILLAALLVDEIFGEYPGWCHPVVWLGNSTHFLLRFAPDQGWWRRFLFGSLVVVIVVGFAAGAAYLVDSLCAGLRVLHIVVGAFLLKSAFALRELGQEAQRVRDAIDREDLDAARIALRSLCSRDPTDLTSEELLEATIESLAENLSDSFVAPLFYFVVLSVPGAVGFRAINTLDAMIGYRGEFEALGKVAARLDDLANWLPARITAGLLLLMGWLVGKNASAGWRILRRDGGKTPSPNGGRPMAALAGLLGVQLKKKGVYVLGDAGEPLTTHTVDEAWRLAWRTGMAMAGVCVAILAAIHWLFASP